MTKKEMWVGIVIILLMLGITSFIMVKNYIKEPTQVSQQTQSTKPSSGGGGSGTIIRNPSGPAPTPVPAPAPKVNEQTIKALLESMGVGELHNPMFSSDTPKIEMAVGEIIYTAEVKKKILYVSKSPCDSEDIRIISSEEEVIKMLQSSGYIITSFKYGGSSVEMVAGKPKLFLKGYLSLYKKLTGEDISE